MRRDEHPIHRKNPSGEYVWVARYTTASGKRRSAGTFEKKGPCRQPADDGSCCGQHAIYMAYEADRLAPTADTRGEPLTVQTYAEKHWLRLHPRSERSDRDLAGRLRTALPIDCGDGPLGGMLFGDIEFRHAIKLIDALLRSGRAVNGVAGILGTLSAMWNDARRDGWAMTANPFMGHRLRQSDPRVQKPARRARVLSWEQMHALAEAAGRYGVTLRSMSDCGLRVGEALGLYREDVKLGQRCDEAGCGVEGPHLHVRRHAWRTEVYAGTKSGDGRVVPIPPALEGMLRTMPRRIDTPLLFPTETGMVWDYSKWRRAVWLPALKQAAVGDVRPHDLRHGWISHVRAAGVDVADAASVAGHTVQTATNVYTHPLNRSYEAMRKAVGA